MFHIHARSWAEFLEASCSSLEEKKTSGVMGFEIMQCPCKCMQINVLLLHMWVYFVNMMYTPTTIFFISTPMRAIGNYSDK